MLTSPPQAAQTQTRSLKMWLKMSSSDRPRTTVEIVPAPSPRGNIPRRRGCRGQRRKTGRGELRRARDYLQTSLPHPPDPLVPRTEAETVWWEGAGKCHVGTRRREDVSTERIPKINQLTLAIKFYSQYALPFQKFLKVS